MRIAVLADIHGNIRALEAVRADMARHSPDVVVNLGDHVSGPLDAALTADLLMAETCVHICGNHDRQVTTLALDEMGPSDRAAHWELLDRHLAWLCCLPPTYTLDAGVLLCHGSPDDDLQYLLEDVVGDGVGLASPETIEQRLGAVHAGLILCGHTHIPRSVRLPAGTWIVNPGSVGLPAYEDDSPPRHYVETGSPHARYAIVDWERSSARVEHIALEYDWEAASAQARAGNRPDWAHALATGFALKAR